MTVDKTVALADIDAGLADAEPHLTASEQRLAVTVYRLLATGESVTAQAAATTTGTSAADVERVLHAWPSVYFDDQDRIIGFWGLALRPMPHRLRRGDVDLFAWCAWDPLFLALIIGAIDVATDDPVTGDTITYQVGPHGTISGLSHPESVLSFLRREQPWDDQIMATFCHYILQFVGSESARRWTANHPDTFIISLDDALHLGRRHVTRSFGATLADM